jgi:D-3-phosphoglycerate dehydrogenase
MKVLVADRFEQAGLEQLEKLGLDFRYNPDLSGEDLAREIDQFAPTILVVRSTKVNTPVMKDSKLKLIIRAGAGYDNIDLDTASRYNIAVANCPGKNSHAVAELTFGLILAIDRHIPDNVEQIRKGIWNKKGFSKAKGLYGRTIGIVGFGRISQEVVSRAKAFGMKVIVFSRWVTPEIAQEFEIEKVQSLKELAERSDIISVHVAYTPETKGLLDESFFDSLKEGTIFINTSRAEVVDQAALEKSLAEGKIFAGLDVFQGEPPSAEGIYEGTLKNYPNVYCTHHIGASTEQAQLAVAEEVIRIIKEFQSSGNILNAVLAK